MSVELVGEDKTWAYVTRLDVLRVRRVPVTFTGPGPYPKHPAQCSVLQPSSELGSSTGRRVDNNRVSRPGNALDVRLSKDGKLFGDPVVVGVNILVRLELLRWVRVCQDQSTITTYLCRIWSIDLKKKKRKF